MISLSHLPKFCCVDPRSSGQVEVTEVGPRICRGADLYMHQSALLQIRRPVLYCSYEGEQD